MSLEYEILITLRDIGPSRAIDVTRYINTLPQFAQTKKKHVNNVLYAMLSQHQVSQHVPDGSTCPIWSVP